MDYFYIPISFIEKTLTNLIIFYKKDDKSQWINYFKMYKNKNIHKMIFFEKGI